MKVTMISSLPPQRGVTPYTMRLLTALAARGDVEPDAIGFRSMYPRWLYPGGAPDAAHADDVSMPVSAGRTLTWYNPFTWLRAGLAVRGDVVHAQWWSWFLAPPFFVALAISRLRGKRIVVTVHNTDPHEGGRLQRLANRLILPIAHLIVVHSERNRKSLIARGVPARRIIVVPMGVDSFLASARPSRQEARAALGLEPCAPLVLFCGNIRPYKDIETLIAAFRVLAEPVPAARLAIVGQPWRGAASVLEAIHRAGIEAQSITRLTYVPTSEMQLFLTAADVVVFPYRRFDAQSAAATDAIAADKAIIVTDVGGLPDLVRDRRAVVPPGDPVSLAAALIDVLSDTTWRKKLEADAAIVRAGLSWDAVAEATVHVYERALQREANPAERAARRLMPGDEHEHAA